MTEHRIIEGDSLGHDAIGFYRQVPGQEPVYFDPSTGKPLDPQPTGSDTGEREGEDGSP